LGLAQRIAQSIPFDRSLPAVGQGIVGIECRSEDDRSIGLVQDLNDQDAWICCMAERAFAQRLQGSCQSPIAGFAERRGTDIVLQGVVGSPDGSKVYRGTIDGDASRAEALGVELANRLLSAGADVLLAEQRAQSQTHS
jgi:hydroxymethylbilane synthase